MAQEATAGVAATKARSPSRARATPTSRAPSSTTRTTSATSSSGASARSTAPRVAAGAVCRQLLASVGVRIWSFVDQLGPIRAFPDAEDPLSVIADDWWKRDLAEPTPLRCPDPVAEAAMRAEVDAVIEAGDSIGGSFVVVAEGLPIGLGSNAGVGHAPRRGAGRGGDGHPGGQGRRDRARVRGRAAARQPGPRRGRRGAAGLGTANQPRRRHRGRHEQRRAGGRARGGQAGGHAAQAARLRRPRDRTERAAPTSSAATSPSCRAPRSWARRWSRWCSPTR